MRNGNHFAEESACGTYVYVERQVDPRGKCQLRQLGRQTVAAGHFYSQGRINLGNSTILYGTFWGSHIASDFGIKYRVLRAPLGEFLITKAIVGASAGSAKARSGLNTWCEPELGHADSAIVDPAGERPLSRTRFVDRHHTSRNLYRSGGELRRQSTVSTS